MGLIPILGDIAAQVYKMKNTPAKVEYETIKREGHTYKRVKGTRDRWINESGEEVDYSGSKPVVISKKEERIGSGDSVSNPDVWIKDGKAYRTKIPGGQKTTYLRAVQELGRYLGWDANVGERSKKAIAKQEEVFNKAKYKNEAGDTYKNSDKGLLLISKPAPRKQKKETQSSAPGSTITRSRPPLIDFKGAVATVSSGWDRLKEGVNQFLYGKPNPNASGNWFYDTVDDLGSRIAGLGVMVQGAAEGTVGAVINGVIGQDETPRKIINGVGSVFDLGRDFNTVAEGLQGNWVAPWNENNAGFLSDNFNWMGTQYERQNLSDILNGTMVLVGTKGSGILKGRTTPKSLVREMGKTEAGTKSVIPVGIGKGKTIWQVTYPSGAIINYLYKGNKHLSTTLANATARTRTFKPQRSNFPKGTKASVVKDLLKKNGAENVTPRNAGHGTMIYRVTYADGTVKDFYYKGKRHISTSEVTTPRSVETSVGYEPVGEPIKPLQEEQPVVASEPVIQLDESGPTPTESTPVAYMSDEPVPTPIEPFVAGVETPKPVAVETPSVPGVVESPVRIAEAAVEKAPEPVPVGVVEPVVERIPEPSVPSTNGTSVGIAEAATGEVPKPVSAVVEQPQPVVGRPLTSYGEPFIYDQPFDKNIVQIGDKVQLHDGSLLTIIGRKGDKFRVSNDLNPGLTATYSADDFSRSYMQNSQPLIGNYSVVRDRHLSIGDDVQLQSSTGYDYGTIASKVDDDTYLVKLSDGTYQKMDDGAILGLDYSRNPEGRFRHYYRQVRNPDLMWGSSFKNFNALAYPERFNGDIAGANEALNFQLQRLGVPIENATNFSAFVEEFANQKVDPIFTFRQLYKAKRRYGFKNGGQIKYFR